MNTQFFKFILLFAFIGLMPCSVQAKVIQAAYIIDGDTFVTTEGEKIRLLDINTPETSKKGKEGEPFSMKAKEALAKLLKERELTFKKGQADKDRYGRTLAHVYTKDGIWVNKALIEAGLAHVYSFPDNRLFAAELLSVEEQARSEKKGIWSLNRWQILDAAHVPVEETVGHFYIVEGKIVDVGESRDTIYLNFGSNWREDFTAEVRKKDLLLFKNHPLEQKEALIGKNVRVRGIIKPVNGTLISVTHPEQLTILE